MKKKFTAIILAMAMIFTLAFSGCSSDDSTAMIMVGLALASEEYDGAEGKEIKQQLEDVGYTVEIAYANTGDEQSEQITAMVDDGASILVVDAVDSSAAQTLESALVDVSNVKVIAYKNYFESDTLTTYVGRDYYNMGQVEANHIIDRLEVDSRQRTITVEMVGLDTASTDEAFEGAMSIFQSYIDEGKISILSNRNTANKCKTSYTSSWIQKMCTKTYANDELRAILCFGEGQSEVVVDGIKNYYQGSIYPVIVGCDCNSNIVTYLSQNYLDMSCFISKDSAITKLVSVVNDAASTDEEVEVDKEYIVYNQAVTSQDYMAQLVESGMYTQNADGTFSEGTSEQISDGADSSEPYVADVSDLN